MRHRLVGSLAAAAESGYACGTERRGHRHATEQAQAWAGSARLTDTFWRAYARGIRAAAKLEQQRLALSPFTLAGP